MDREKLKKQLIIDEGLKLKLYKDTEGIETIGVGRNIRDNWFTDSELFFLKLKGSKDQIISHIRTIGISKEDAMYLLDNDISKVMADINKKLPWVKNVPDEVLLVISNMCFNLGMGRLLRFKVTLDLLKNFKWSEASIEMLNSKWARQVGDRAVRLSNIIKSLVK